MIFNGKRCFQVKIVIAVVRDQLYEKKGYDLNSVPNVTYVR